MAKILLAEDDKELVRLLSRYITALNHEIETAGDGVEGLEKFKSGSFDGVITDLMMPRMGGLELIREIRTIDQDAIIIVITGHASLETAIESIRWGAYDYLQKPFSLEELSVTLNRALEKRKLRLDLNATVNELTKVNKKLSQSQQKLKEALDRNIENEKLKLLYQVASFIAHDLKNSASVFSLISENLLKKISGDPVLEELAVAITEEMKKMQNIVDTFSSLPTRLRIEFQKVNLHDIVYSTVKSYQSFSNVTVNFNLADLPLIDADQRSLQVVMNNVVKNAYESMSEGGELTISTELIQAKGKDKESMVCIKVKDSGTGLPPHLHKKGLFKPFQTTKKKGLGMGLYQCKEIVSRHRGTIELYNNSSHEKGVTSMVKLPVKQKAV